jgi:hypothetical protein
VSPGCYGLIVRGWLPGALNRQASEPCLAVAADVLARSAERQQDQALGTGVDELAADAGPYVGGAVRSDRVLAAFMPKPRA